MPNIQVTSSHSSNPGTDAKRPSQTDDHSDDPVFGALLFAQLALPLNNDATSETPAPTVEGVGQTTKADWAAMLAAVDRRASSSVDRGGGEGDSSATRFGLLNAANALSDPVEENALLFQLEQVRQQASDAALPANSIGSSGRDTAGYGASSAVDPSHIDVAEEESKELESALQRREDASSMREAPGASANHARRALLLHSVPETQDSAGITAEKQTAQAAPVNMHAPTGLSANASDAQKSGTTPIDPPLGVAEPTPALGTASLQNEAQEARAITIGAPVGAAAWAQELGEKLNALIHARNQFAELHLHPRELGPISVHISLDGDQATLSFAAAEAATQQALEAALPRLRELLAESGINLGQATVGAELMAQHHAFAGFGRHAPGREGAAAREFAPASNEANSTTLASAVSGNIRRTDGRIDTFA